MSKIEEKIYEEVKRRCSLPSNTYGIGAWDHHIKLVYDLAKKNYKKYNAKREIVVLAALLHDIASVTNKDYTENHHIIGADIAEELLKKENYPEVEINQVKTCILNHRGSVLKEKNTPEEVCIADCDAMAHFYAVPSLLSMVYKEKGLSIDDGADFVLKKLERSYKKLSDIGKREVKEHYDAAVKILTSYKM